MGLLVRRSGGFSKPNHLYVKNPSDEIGLQPVDDKAVEKMVATESEKQPSSGRKNGCAGVGNVAPSKVTLRGLSYLVCDSPDFFVYVPEHS